VEGVVIVGSILLALRIEAWWDEVRTTSARLDISPAWKPTSVFRA